MGLPPPPPLMEFPYFFFNPSLSPIYFKSSKMKSTAYFNMQLLSKLRIYWSCRPCFCILNSSRNAFKKNFLGGGYPQKKNPKGPPFGYFGNFFKISKYIPIIEKSQGSPLWIFWKNFQNFKKNSNNKKIPRVPPLDILRNLSKFQKNLQ